MKIIIVLGTIIIILLAILFVLPARNRSKVVLPNASPTLAQTDQEDALEKAKQLFAQDKTAGISMENGPCLSEEIIPDWAFDIAHNPRQPVDNQPENQCQSYLEGKVHHFVELDRQGNLIKAI